MCKCTTFPQSIAAIEDEHISILHCESVNISCSRLTFIHNEQGRSLEAPGNIPDPFATHVAHRTPNILESTAYLGQCCLRRTPDDNGKSIEIIFVICILVSLTIMQSGIWTKKISSARQRRDQKGVDGSPLPSDDAEWLSGAALLSLAHLHGRRLCCGGQLPRSIRMKEARGCHGSQCHPFSVRNSVVLGVAF